MVSLFVDLGVDIVSSWPSTSVPFNWLYFWIILTLGSVVAALAVYFGKPTGAYNPKISLIRNGVTLIGVLLSALAFNLPASWGTGIGWIPSWSTVIGWFLIAITLMSLEPIWKSEAATDADARELAWARKEIARLKDELAQQSNSKKSLAQQIRPLLEKVGRKVKGLIP
jgi:hypothetical protein